MSVHIVVATAASLDEGKLNLPTIKMMLVGSDTHQRSPETIAQSLEEAAKEDHQKRYGSANTVVTSRIRPVSSEYLVELSSCAESRVAIFRAEEVSRT